MLRIFTLKFIVQQKEKSEQAEESTILESISVVTERLKKERQE